MKSRKRAEEIKMEKLTQWDLTAWLESVVAEGYIIGLDLSNRDLSELDFVDINLKSATSLDRICLMPPFETVEF